jgi:hypothetical protein
LKPTIYNIFSFSRKDAKAPSHQSSSSFIFASLRLGARIMGFKQERVSAGRAHPGFEAVSEYQFWFFIKAGEGFNHRNTLSILRISADASLRV